MVLAFFSLALHVIDGEEDTESYASQLAGNPACIGNLEMVQSYVLAIWHLIWQCG